MCATLLLFSLSDKFCPPHIMISHRPRTTAQALPRNKVPADFRNSRNSVSQQGRAQQPRVPRVSHRSTILETLQSKDATEPLAQSFLIAVEADHRTAANPIAWLLLAAPPPSPPPRRRSHPEMSKHRVLQSLLIAFSEIPSRVLGEANPPRNQGLPARALPTSADQPRPRVPSLHVLRYSSVYGRRNLVPMFALQVIQALEVPCF
ncbi:hypothetical protein LZ30DRAFT_138621 [Colletotrichum cereale]|nr:hypothetical protein LZ30DRAFT_138621 [Colletotrichum cereale]